MKTDSKRIAAMQEASRIIENLEKSFGSYRSNAAKLLRSARLRLKGEIIADQFALADW